MGSAAHRPVVKRTARAILLDLDPAEPHGPASIVLIKRTRPGCTPYWVTPGGGVEPDDASVVDALRREVDEEIGGKVADVVPAFVDTVAHHHHDDGTLAHPHGVKVQHFFVCRLDSMDPARRHGPEVEQPAGEYEIVRLPFTREGVTSVNVVPPSLRAYLAANIEGVRALLASDLA
ncbi:NUDIX hydrolase [Peterkaempfera bronchialis]|uniref:NUDIX hydrolase n=1 Tax=Peterkaempfera bronchialis TaxID=2126346 RepID=A0A345SY63_9ACTN|nr:NUDIX hydrolase [Peterkaempfera bronchialis]AXI78668.1 NUDIX hydrolase [Peterkaempfera bronchialis]